MPSLQTPEIPADAVCKTVTVHDSKLSIDMLIYKMTRQTDLMIKRTVWYQEKGYIFHNSNFQNDLPQGPYGPYIYETTVTRFWKSKQDAEDWIQLTRQIHQACGIADSEVNIELVEI